MKVGAEVEFLTSWDALVTAVSAELQLDQEHNFGLERYTALADYPSELGCQHPYRTANNRF